MTPALQINQRLSDFKRPSPLMTHEEVKNSIRIWDTGSIKAQHVTHRLLRYGKGGTLIGLPAPHILPHWTISFGVIPRERLIFLSF